MKQSRSRRANALAKAEKLAQGKPAMSKYEAKRRKLGEYDEPQTALAAALKKALADG